MPCNLDLCENGTVIIATCPAAHFLAEEPKRLGLPGGGPDRECRTIGGPAAGLVQSGYATSERYRKASAEGPIALSYCYSVIILIFDVQSVYNDVRSLLAVHAGVPMKSRMRSCLWQARDSELYLVRNSRDNLMLMRQRHETPPPPNANAPG